MDFAYSPRTAFAIKLPAGRYQLRLRGEDGGIVEGTTKTWKCSRPAGRHRVPGDSRTQMDAVLSIERPQRHFLPGRKRIFYVLPHYAEEYNRINM